MTTPDTHWRIGVDTGGTFTDIVAVNQQTGERRVHKVPSTPSHPSDGFITGLMEVLGEVGASAAEVALLSHGTTVATNAILESNYARVGLIVTRGYRGMLECARQTVPGDFGDYTWWRKPPRVVPLELVREANGRLTHRGEEIRPIDEDEIRAIAREYQAMDVNAIAVSLIHSYRNPEHEHRVGELIAEVYPDCYVSLSSDVIREYREYERTLSTCLNTGLMPLVSAYIENLHEGFEGSDLRVPLYVMKSSGGVTPASEIVKQPIAAVLSGPAAGVLTAAYYATTTQRRHVITLDVGGTSSDICLIDDGTPHMLTEGRIDVFDIKTPMVDIHTVGAGGGSIAWVAGGRSLRVGPQSAGAVPGPACYGKGGDLPTVTDAHVVLGRVPPYLLGGDIELDVERAREAIRRHIGDPLGLNLETAASGILEMASATIVQGVNVVSVKRGRDPRDYALVPFGGAGGMAACLVADLLSIDTIIVPPSPGVTSAEGLLYADVRADHVITDVQRQDQFDVARLNSELQSVYDAAVDELLAHGFEREQVAVDVFVDMRYATQAYELRVPLVVDDPSVDVEVLQTALSEFHRLHDDRYGYAYAESELVELVNIGANAKARFPGTPTTTVDGGGATWDDALRSVRQAYFTSVGGFIDCPVYARSGAPIGVPLSGPAIVEQYDATLVIEPGWDAAQDEVGQILLTRVTEQAKRGL